MGEPLGVPKEPPGGGPGGGPGPREGLERGPGRGNWNGWRVEWLEGGLETGTDSRSRAESAVADIYMNAGKVHTCALRSCSTLDRCCSRRWCRRHRGIVDSRLILIAFR